MEHYEQLTHPGIRSLVPYKPGKAIEELAREKGLTDIIKMASNENPQGCSPLALEAIRNMSSQLLATYPSPSNHPLIPKLAAQLNIEKEQLFVSNGSDFIYGLLLNCFSLHQNKHILTHQYAFSTYAIQAQSLNIEARTADVDEDWQVNIENLIQCCNSKTSIIFLANPNNPTGVLISAEKIHYLLEKIPSTTLIVIDEAYYEFAVSYYRSNSLDWLVRYPNLIITRTFSKIYGLAGLRLGYAIAHPSIISLLYKVQLPFTVNQVALTAAHAALDDKEFIDESLMKNKEGMQQIQKGLHQLELNYLPSACNFLTFDCQEDGVHLYNYLLDQGIIVRPLHPYQMNNYIRVTIGTPEQNNRFLQTLKKYFSLKRRKAYE